MYCPVCFQDTLKLRSNGVVKLAFNGKSRNTSLFTYNLLKDKGPDLVGKLREKIVDFFQWYATFQNRSPLKTFEATSSDIQCSNHCKIDLINTRVSVVGVLYTVPEVRQLLDEEAAKHGIELQIVLK